MKKKSKTRDQLNDSFEFDIEQKPKKSWNSKSRDRVESIET